MKIKIKKSQLEAPTDVFYNIKKHYFNIGHAQIMSDKFPVMLVAHHA